MLRIHQKFNHCFALFTILIGCSSELLARSEMDLKRDASSKPYDVLKFSGLKAGDMVLDFLAGGGYYSELIAEVVAPDGHVVLQNNQAYLPYVGKELDVRLAKGKLKNVSKLMSEVENLNLGTERFDMVFFVLGYHDLYVKDKDWNMPAEKVIPQLFNALKPKGKLLIVDHSAVIGSGSHSAQSLHRIEAEFVKNDLTGRGFKLVRTSDLLQNQADSRTINVFEPQVRRKTDRFIMLFEKVSEPVDPLP